ncbi:MAG: hypothetical protein GC145_12300 [Caulobacter sp.]|nr:hypothetical protein [Caulobacter sp.]
MAASVSYEEMTMLAVIFAVIASPFIASTIISFRMGRRRWWLALPWVLLVATIAGAGWCFVALGEFEADNSPALIATIVVIVGGWIACAIHLAVLAIAGPKLPALTVGEVF